MLQILPAVPRSALGPAILLLAPLSGAPAQEEAGSASHLGTWESTIHGLHCPSAVAIGPDGKVHVAEATGDQVRVFSRGGEQLAVLGAGELKAPRGVAVAPDGTRFIADTGNHQIVVYDADGVRLRAFGGLGAGEGRLHTPRGLDADGQLVAVADQRNRRVQVFDHSGELQAVLDLAAAGANTSPVDVALGAHGELHVLDAAGHRVLTFDAEGHWIGQLGEFGFFPGTFARPGGLGRVASRLMVADHENHRVQVFEAGALRGSALAAKPAYTLGTHAIRPREGQGKLHYPADVAASRDGQFAALAEPWDDRVQLFARAPGSEPEIDPLRTGLGQASTHFGPWLALDGPLLAIVEPETAELVIFDLRQVMPGRRIPPIMISRCGGHGDRLGLYGRPTGMHLDAQERSLLVCDASHHQLHELHLDYDPGAEIVQDYEMVSAVRMLDFTYLERERAWITEPQAVERGPGGSVYVLDVANEQVLLFSQALELRAAFGGHGTGKGELRAPSDLALSPDGKLVYVTDTDNSRVAVFEAGGAPHSELRADGLRIPHGVAVGADGRVYVSDLHAHAVLVFSPEGEHLTTFGSRGLGRGELYNPRDLSFSSSGELFVMDHGNHRGVILTPDGEFLDAFGPRAYVRPARDPESYSPGDLGE